MSIVRTQKKKKNFTIIHNEVLQDERLSFEARGLLCYLLSKPDDWVCRMGDLQKAGSIGRFKIRAILKELSDLGYAKLQINRGKDGKVGGKSWVIYEDPSDPKVTEPPFGESANRKVGPSTVGKTRRREKPTVDKPTDILSTDSIQSTEEEKNKECTNARTENFDSKSKEEKSPSPKDPSPKEEDVARDQCSNIEFDPTEFIIEAIKQTPRAIRERWAMSHAWTQNLSPGQLEQLAFDFSQYYIAQNEFPENRKNWGMTQRRVQGAFYKSWICNHKRIEKSNKKQNGKTRQNLTPNHAGYKTDEEYFKKWD